MGSFRGTHGEREPITGVEGRTPSGVPGQSPWSGGQGAKPPEAESFLALGRATDRANLYTLCSILSNPLQLYGSWLGGAEFPTRRGQAPLLPPLCPPLSPALPTGMWYDIKGHQWESFHIQFASIMPEL